MESGANRGSVALLLFLAGSLGSISCRDCPALYARNTTTEELRSTIIGRCLYYQQFINQEAFCDKKRDCEEIYHLFTKAYLGQSRCNVTKENYLPFIEATSHQYPENKFVFWSGVYEIVSRYSNSGKVKTTIADTMTGYVLDNLIWCDVNGTSNVNEESPSKCPSWSYTEDCPSSASRSFWQMASIKFAENAVGDIQVMLAADREPAFREKSEFAMSELPHLNARKVTSVEILLVTALGKNTRETCDSTSVKKLLDLLKARNFTTKCTENPRNVMLLLCADDPSAIECSDYVFSGVAKYAPIPILTFFYFLVVKLI